MTSHSTIKLCATVLPLALLSACGTSEKELEYRRAQEERARVLQERRAQADRELPARQLELRKQVEARMAAGEKPPPKVQDLGFPIAKCKGLTPGKYIVSAQGPMRGVFVDVLPSPDWYCGNTDEGRAILAYREWYCGKNFPACIQGEWKGGDPLFKNFLRNSVNNIEPCRNTTPYCD